MIIVIEYKLYSVHMCHHKQYAYICVYLFVGRCKYTYTYIHIYIHTHTVHTKYIDIYIYIYKWVTIIIQEGEGGREGGRERRREGILGNTEHYNDCVIVVFHITLSDQIEKSNTMHSISIFQKNRHKIQSLT